MATSNKYKECAQETHAICVVFEPSGEEGTPESFFCATCGVNRKFHCQEKAEQPIATVIRYPTSNVHYPPTRPPPPPPKPAQPPVLKYQKVILGDPEEEMREIRKSRTIFTTLQKYHLREFSEKIGWTMRGQDKGEIDGFCDAIGISRPVLKNWLNNHKPRMEIRQSSFAPICLEHNN